MPGAGLLLLPELGLEIDPALQGKAAVESRCLLKGDCGCLNQKCGGTAARIDQRNRSIPAGEPDQTSRQVFFDGCTSHRGSVPPAMQAAAASIKAEQRLSSTQMQVQRQIGILQIDGGSLSPTITLLVHQGILHLQSREMAVVQPRS